MAEDMWPASGRLPVVWGEAGTCFEIDPCYFSVPTPRQVRWYWDGWGRGLQGVFFFARGPGDSNRYKLFHADGSPKDAVPRIAELASAGRAFRGLLRDARPARAEIGIYFPRATLIHEQSVAGGFWGIPFQAWLSLYMHGITIERVCVDTLHRAADLKMLVLPAAAYLEADAADGPWEEETWGRVFTQCYRLGPLLPRLAEAAGLRREAIARDGLVNVSVVESGDRELVFVTDPTGRRQRIRMEIPSFSDRTVLDLLSGEPCGTGATVTFDMAPGQIRLLAAVRAR